MRRFAIILLAHALAFATLGCGEGTVLSAAEDSRVAPPLENCPDGYACAMKTKLPTRAPEDGDGLHQVFRLSKNIISGAEPEGEAAYKRIAAMGVKTILSVDGKVPDAALARKYGLRYVHVPIRYSGISEEELTHITKTFREQEGPFFVHCFHGKHRGPAGAAIGRLVLDGVDRETALAEMAQWCGTAQKYEGLFQTIAKAKIPTAAETKKVQWGFDEAHPFQGIRAGMIDLTRAFDNLKYLAKRDWKPSPDHPDLDAVNEAEKTKQHLVQMAASDELKKEPTDFQAWLKESATDAIALHEALYEAQKSKEGALERTKDKFRTIKNLCAQCHKKYRNED